MHLSASFSSIFGVCRCRSARSALIPGRSEECDLDLLMVLFCLMSGWVSSIFCDRWETILQSYSKFRFFGSDFFAHPFTIDLAQLLSPVCFHPFTTCVQVKSTSFSLWRSLVSTCRYEIRVRDVTQRSQHTTSTFTVIVILLCTPLSSLPSALNMKTRYLNGRSSVL